VEEARRLHCLRVLGIERFLPRRPLPGAGDHAVYEAPAPSPKQLSKPTVSSRPAPPVPPKAGQELPFPRPMAPASAPAAAASAPRFTLALAAIGSTLVVDSLPPKNQPPQGWLRFLGELLSAGLPAEEAAKEEIRAILPLIRWPPGLRGAGRGEDAPRDYMAAKLKKVLRGENFSRLLLLGDAAARFVSLPDEGLAVTKCSGAAAAMTDNALREKLQKELLSLRE